MNRFKQLSRVLTVIRILKKRRNLTAIQIQIALEHCQRGAGIRTIYRDLDALEDEGILGSRRSTKDNTNRYFVLRGVL